MNQKLADIINSENIKLNIYENLIEYVVDATFDDINIHGTDFYDDLVNEFNYGDDFKLEISTEYSDKATLTNCNDTLNFVNKINNEIIKNKDEDEKYNFKLTIFKNELLNVINVYCLDSFLDYIDKLSLLEQFKFFDKHRIKNLSTFKLIDVNDKLVTNTFIFSNIVCDDKFKRETMDREELLDKRSLNSSFISGEKLDFIPGDFNIICESSNSRLNSIIRRLLLVSTLIFISNVAIFNTDNSLDCRIIGYKTLKININSKSVVDKDVIEQLYSIYNWIYSSRNISDKLGLARNMLSLGISEKLEIISENLFESINSAHEIYLKENIREYLEVKAKVTEFLFDLSQKTSELSGNVGKALFNNIIALITFYISIILMNSLSENKLTNIFTKDISCISLVFIIGSIIYMIISFKETKKELQRYEKVYFRVKGSYDDVLDNDDINKIFKDDEYLNEDKEFILKRSNMYLKVWILLLLILLILIIILGYEHTIKPVLYYLNIFINLIRK